MTAMHIHNYHIHNCADKEGTITIYAHSIIDKIKDLAYIHAQSMTDVDDVKKAAYMDIAQDRNIERSKHMMELAISECVDMLSGMSKVTCSFREAADNHDDGIRPKYIIRLSIPDNLPKSVIQSIGYQVEEYIIGRIMQDWSELTIPDVSQIWANKALSAERAIREVRLFRVGQITRKLSPF